MLISLTCGCAQVQLFPLPPSSPPMHPIPAHKHQSVVSLLLAGESVREVTKKTGVGKSTVGEIRKEVLPNKENIKNGRPSKLTPHDKRRIIHQIESGKLDTAVQAAELINSISTNHICAQTARNSLKEDNMRSVVKA